MTPVTTACPEAGKYKCEMISPVMAPSMQGYFFLASDLDLHRQEAQRTTGVPLFEQSSQ